MILVTGSNGMVGSYVPSVFEGEELHLTDRRSMDITDYDAINRMFEKVKPTIVLHLAAQTDVDGCETDQENAFQTNMVGTENVALACQKYNASLVYLSTVYVFGSNKKEVYTEFDKPSPISIYGQSKYEGERVVRDLLNRYFIIRAGWMIGGGRKDKKFVSKMVKLCLERDEVEAVNDKYGSVTFAKDMLKNIRELISTPFYGTYHMANEGKCTRFDIAVEIANYLGVKTKVNPVGSERFPLPAPRGESEIMHNYRLQLRGLDRMSHWKEALNEYLTELEINS